MDGSLAERLIPAKLDYKDGLKIRIWDETKILWRIALPSILSRVAGFGIIVITQLYIGHVDKLNLAAYALVQSFFVRFVNGILDGMASAAETLCGQAFGAEQYHMMGIYLQRSWILDFTVATVLVPLFIFVSPILRFLGQDEEITSQAGQIALWFIPFLYYYVFALTIQMYLQAQLKNMVIGWLSTLSFLLHLFLSWFLVTKLGFGLHGAMAALVISSWSIVIGEFVYVFGGWCPHTWKGFSVAAFSGIWPLLKLSVSSAVMLCLEMWYNAILVLVAGYMPNASTAISAFSICLNINIWELMICLGFFNATIVRVANELGRGNPEAVKFSIRVSLFISISIGVLCMILCFAFGHKIAYVFTTDEDVAPFVSDLSVLLSLSMLLNSIQTVLVGVVVGAGMQNTAAIINFVSYYGIGVPFGILLAYVAHLEVYGLWLGMLIGVVVQIFFFGYIIWTTDWDYQVFKASERLKLLFVKEKEETIADFVS